MQTEQTGRSTKELEPDESFECENARGDFVAITEKNKKQFFRLQLKIYTGDPRGGFPL